MNRILAAALFAIALPASAFAAPVLREDVRINGPIVTVGDMFDDAGTMAGTPLFRSPLPGTTGLVSLADVAAAAARIGFSGYETAHIERVRVVRGATVVDAATIAGLVADEIARRGLKPEGTEAVAQLAQRDLSINAEQVDAPVRLADLTFRAGSPGFTARIEIAGLDLPVDVSGTVTFTVEAPHLVAAMKAGDVIDADDIEMRPIPADFADRSNVAQVDQLIGKMLKRNARDGLLLRASDVTEPLAVHRNARVTVTVHTGAMTLTMQGQALADAAAGQRVRVMNPITNKILTGVATAAGTIEIAPGGLALAGL